MPEADDKKQRWDARYETGNLPWDSGRHDRNLDATGTVRAGYRARVAVTPNVVVEPARETETPPLLPIPYPKRNAQAAWAKTDRGQYLLFNGNVEAAGQQFHEAVRLDDSYGAAWAGLATVWQKQGKHAQAKACAQRAYDLGKRDGVILKMLDL